jgi:YlmC/YmxH family sporulation protein
MPNKLLSVYSCGGLHMLFSELKSKDVINIRDCKKLGNVCDMEFDACTGCICKIIVPGGNKLFSFLRCEPEIVIPFKDIKQIGPDIILVDINV